MKYYPMKQHFYENMTYEIQKAMKYYSMKYHFHEIPMNYDFIDKRYPKAMKSYVMKYHFL